jgi:hypothetical protein
LGFIKIILRGIRGIRFLKNVIGKIRLLEELIFPISRVFIINNRDRKGE